MNKSVTLDVPYYSEFDFVDRSNEHRKTFKRRSCGIVSAKMIADYWASKGVIKKVSLKDIIGIALKHHAYSLKEGGRKGSGWVHSGIVKTMQDVGLKGWRRMWFLRPEDIRFFNKEGLNDKSMKGYYDQASEEAFVSFKKSIDDGNPFMVSIDKNLGVKKSPHLIVITGYREIDGKIKGFYVNDPHNPKNGKKVRPQHKDQYLSLGNFDKMWRKRAIFIVPKK